MNLDFSRVSIRKLVLWLIAIVIVSFTLGFVILNLTVGFPSADRGFLVTPGNISIPVITHESVTPDGAVSADVFIGLDVGELTIRGGADDQHLMDATITSSRPELRPEITYSSNQSHGALRIVHNTTAGNVHFPLNMHNRWNIQLNQEIPLNLEINTGVGETKLDAGALNLTRLRINAGTGDVTIDFSGESRPLPDTEITTGVGDLTVRVPAGLASRVIVENGVGEIIADGFVKNNAEYTTPGFSDASGHVQDIRIKQGVGSIRLEVV